MAMTADAALLLHASVALVTCLVFALASVLSCYYCLVHVRLIQPKASPHIANIPLQTLESWLIRSLYVGLALFTFLLISSFYTFSPQAIISPLGHFKIWLSCALWLLWVVLLLGRRFWGWRGECMAFALVLGATLLSLLYIWA